MKFIRQTVCPTNRLSIIASQGFLGLQHRNDMREIDTTKERKMERLKSIKGVFSDRGRAMPFNEAGQSIIILAFAFLALMSMLGLALDLGLVYIARVRLKRAIDAATLAAATELPIEEEAARRAVGFLNENGYDKANVYVAGCIQDIYDVYGDGANDNLTNWPDDTDFFTDLLSDDGTASITETLSTSSDVFYHYVKYDPNGDGQYDDPGVPNFFIDTRSFQVRTLQPDGVTPSGQSTQCGDDALPFVPVSDTRNYGSSSKIRIVGQIAVDMNFMQFFGWESFPIADESIAQNSANLDAVVVLDVTGSMEFDTICYDCWVRTGGNDKYKPYPTNGLAYPYDYYSSAVTALRTGDPEPPTGQNYIIIEAEFYSLNTSVWDPAYRSSGQGYWALQRYPSASGYSIDGRSGYVRHHPYYQRSDTYVDFGRHYWLEDAQSGAAPRLEYDFKPTWPATSNTWIYIRVQAFRKNSNSTSSACTAQPPVPYPSCTNRNDYPWDAIYWAVDSSSTIQENSVVATPGNNANDNSNIRAQNSWNWIKVNAGGLSQNDLHTLKIWAGSSGYAIDRVIITSQNVDMSSSGLRNDPATPGSAQRMAADVCNPIFGEAVTADDCTFIQLETTSIDNINDPLWADRQPIRGAKESIRAFVDRLDPALDQAGFVKFSSTAYQVAQLECLQAAQVREQAIAVDTERPNYPLDASVLNIEFDETACHDEGEVAASADEPIQFQTVFVGIEDADHGGSTDIADGLRRGLHMMGVTTDNDGTQTNDCDWTLNSGTWRIGGSTQPDTNTNSHCARGQAATPVIVLLTDGAPTDGSPGDNAECKAWTGTPYDDFPVGDNKYECIMYYAEIAGQNGIIVYTIGLGVGADPDLLRAVADETNGQYYFAPSAAQLNIIFNQILANIYVRLIQ